MVAAIAVVTLADPAGVPWWACPRSTPPKAARIRHGRGTGCRSSRLRARRRQAASAHSRPAVGRPPVARSPGAECPRVRVLLLRARPVAWPRPCRTRRCRRSPTGAGPGRQPAPVRPRGQQPAAAGAGATASPPRLAGCTPRPASRVDVVAESEARWACTRCSPCTPIVPLARVVLLSPIVAPGQVSYPVGGGSAEVPGS